MWWRLPALRGFLVFAATLLLIAAAAQSERLIFLSTQLRPIGEAQKLRNSVLKDFPQEVEYVTAQPQEFAERVKAEQQGAAHSIDAVGALHGELLPLVSLDALVALDDLAGKLAGHGIPAQLLTLGKLGTAHQLYIPWMQASYIMVANKAALPYLPEGADINALSYDELAIWASTIEQRVGKQLLGFPAGPQGLMHRFCEGFLYPSYTGGVVVPFRSAAAEAMWVRFAALWKSVNPNSASYNFMRQPLLSGEVWIGFDHIARVLEALREKPDEFVAFPAPAGPKGRGYMRVLAGLGVPRNAPDPKGGMALIEYLTRPETQIAIARGVGFFPVANLSLPADLDPGLKMAVSAVDKMQSSTDGVPTLQPVGLGRRDGDFDKIFMDTFQLIVLRNQNPRAVLNREAERLNRLLAEAGARCWEPDPPGSAACQAE